MPIPLATPLPYYLVKNCKTSAGCASAFPTGIQCFLTLPSGPIKAVERIGPSTVSPCAFCRGPHAPYAFITSSWGSDNRAKGRLNFAMNWLCDSMLSRLTPKTTAFACVTG